MKIKRCRNLKSLVPIVLCIANMLSLCLTQISALAGNENINTLLKVKGYNLMEFSPLGVVVLVVPICLLTLHYSNITDLGKQIGTVLLLVLNSAGYTVAFIKAGKWLGMDVKMIDYHWGIPIYIIITLMMFVTTYLSDKSVT